jgi:PAS domain S-box-containing protein
LTGKLVSQEKSAEISDRESELIDFFQKAPISLHWLSGTGDVIWANETEMNSLGYTAEEYIGHNIMEFCPEEKEALTEVFTALSTGKTIHNAPFKFRTKTGEAKYLTVDSNVSFHSDGTFKHTRCFIRDDTERRVREAIQEAHMKQMKLSSAAKDRFIRRVFHEIRTPMHTVSSCLNGCSVNNYSRGEMEELGHQTESCLGLIEDLAFATMIESGNLLRLQPRELHLKSVLSIIEEQVRAAAIMNNKKAPSAISMIIDGDVPAMIRIDKCFIRALFNLIHNISNLSHANGYLITHLASVMLAVSAKNKRKALVLDTASSKNVLYGEIRASIGPNVTVDIVEIHKSFHSYYNADLAPAEAMIISNSSTNLTDSLTSDSTSSNSLGWFVAYNVIQNVGGELTCEVKDNEIVFSFDVSYEPLTLSNPMDIDTEHVELSVADSPCSYPTTPLAIDANVPTTVPMAESSLASEHLLQDDIEKLIDDGCAMVAAKKQKCSKRILVVDDSPICQKVMVKSLSAHNFEADVASNGQVSSSSSLYPVTLSDRLTLYLTL